MKKTFKLEAIYTVHDIPDDKWTCSEEAQTLRREIGRDYPVTFSKLIVRPHPHPTRPKKITPKKSK